MKTLRPVTILISALALFTDCGLAQTPPSFTTLYSFPGGISGGNPLAGLTPGHHSQFYGTTNLGGSSDLGTAFSLAPLRRPAFGPGR